MKLLNIVLTGIYAMFAAVGIGLFVTGKASIASIFITVSYVAIGLALNGKGGKIIRYLSLFTSSILSIMLLFAIYVTASPLFGEQFDLALFGISLVIGVIGVATTYLLITMKKHATIP